MSSALVLVSYFNQIFSTTSPSAEVLNSILSGIQPVISPSMNAKLLAPFNQTEVGMAVKQMFPTKAPRPDHFLALFYQTYWDFVGGKTVSSCLEILNGRKSVRGWNKTNMALIPKVPSPISVSDYRPINLRNVSYKIVSKVLVNCMKFILCDVISKTQSAFIPGRAIMDNIIIAHECLNHMYRKRRGSVGMAALKLDMSQAYDRVEWAFLEEIMKRLSFDDRWIRLIMDCVSMSEFSVLINGVPCGKIIPSRGLR